MTNTDKLTRADWDLFAAIFNANEQNSFPVTVKSLVAEKGYAIVEGTLSAVIGDEEVTRTFGMMLHASSFERPSEGASEAEVAAVRNRANSALQAACAGGTFTVQPTGPSHIGKSHKFNVRLA